MINFGKVIVDQTKAGSETVNYEGSSKPTFTISSSKTTCTAVTTSITPILPVSQTLYFGENGRVVDANGDFYLTNQGYGVLGTTDANGVLTVNTLVPAVSITAPSASAEYEIGDTVTITWTSSNIANLDLVVESGSGLLTVEDINASLGTYTFNLTADSGTFYPNDTISISLTDCLGVASDTVNIVSIATITITPAIGNQTAGVAFNVAGTTNLPDGADVEVFADATSKGTATVASGAFTKSVTIADPATGVVMKVDDVLNANAYDTETIDVASAQVMWAQFPSTGGDTGINTAFVLGDYIYASGYSKATSFMGESTGVGGGVTYVVWVAKISKTAMTKTWIKFYPVYTPFLGQNLIEDADYLYFTATISTTNSKLYKIAKSDGATSTSVDLDVASSTDTAVTGIVKSSSYFWMVGYTSIGAYDTRIWRINTDLSGLTSTSIDFGGTDYSSYGCISADNNYLIVFDYFNNQIELVDISTGTPSDPNKTIIERTAYGKIVASNTKWMMQTRAGVSTYTRRIRRTPFNDIANATYDQSRGNTNANDVAGDMRFIGTKFYSLFYDSANAKFVIDRYADSDTYTLEASVDVTPNTITATQANTHSFINFNGTQGCIAMSIKGKIDASASTSTSYYDVVFKLFNLP